jgi:histidinol-phosphate/aromatic aminotransferase/cobyric acid decarboxylase-like protein
MTTGTLSRWDFARAVGFAMGATLVAPALPESLHARLGPGMSGEWIQLNANENPYGPPAGAREAMTRSQQIAARYPDHVEGQLIEAIAKLHGVAPENILLGCGSSEILSMADTAFTTPDKNVVVAEPTYEVVLSYARLTRAESIKIRTAAMPASYAKKTGKRGSMHAKMGLRIAVRQKESVDEGNAGSAIVTAGAFG